MKKYYISSSYLVEANEREVVFYTKTGPTGIISTVLWKYQIDTDKLECCFKIRKELLLWKYPAIKGNGDLQYIGIQYPGGGYVVGLNSEGKELFNVTLGNCADISNGQFYDAIGNLYLSVDEQWIFCLSSTGELQWKWKSAYAISDINMIDKYWIYHDKLYVITCGHLYVISAKGEVEEDYNAGFFEYPGIKYKICGERILYIDLKGGELVCCDFKGKNLWRSRADKDEIYLNIEACEKNMILVKAMVREKYDKRLYAFDEKGNKRWEMQEEWGSLCISTGQEIVLCDDHDVSVYGPDGQKRLQTNSKKYHVWANIINDTLLSIAEGRGKIAVMKQDRELKRKPVMTKLPEIEDDEAIETERENFWRREIAETLLMNLELFCKKFQGDILELKVVCVPFEFMEIRVLTDENIWENAMIEDIPCEEVTEDEKDIYKECCERNDIIWTEFCLACPEGRIRTVMESACTMINKKMNVSVSLELS